MNLPQIVTAKRSTTSRVEYIARVTGGGFPPALQRETYAARARWFDDYTSLCLERDVADLARIQQKAALPQLLTRLAAQTAQTLNVAAAGQAAGLKTRAAENYTKLLEALFLAIHTCASPASSAATAASRARSSAAAWLWPGNWWARTKMPSSILPGHPGVFLSCRVPRFAASLRAYHSDGSVTALHRRT